MQQTGPWGVSLAARRRAPGHKQCTSRRVSVTGWGYLLPCRFVCRQRLGGRKGEPAAYLTPVPLNAVVYGTGDAARIITKVSRLLGCGTSEHSPVAHLLTHVQPWGWAVAL